MWELIDITHRKRASVSKIHIYNYYKLRNTENKKIKVCNEYEFKLMKSHGLIKFK